MTINLQFASNDFTNDLKGGEFPNFQPEFTPGQLGYQGGQPTQFPVHFPGQYQDKPSFEQGPFNGYSPTTDSSPIQPTYSINATPTIGTNNGYFTTPQSDISPRRFNPELSKFKDGRIPKYGMNDISGMDMSDIPMAQNLPMTNLNLQLNSPSVKMTPNMSIPLNMSNIQGNMTENNPNLAKFSSELTMESFNIPTNEVIPDSMLASFQASPSTTTPGYRESRNNSIFGPPLGEMSPSQQAYRTFGRGYEGQYPEAQAQNLQPLQPNNHVERHYSEAGAPNFSEMNLKNSYYSETNLKNTNYSGVNLKNTNYSEMNLKNFENIKNNLSAGPNSPIKTGQFYNVNLNPRSPNTRADLKFSDSPTTIDMNSSQVSPRMNLDDLLEESAPMSVEDLLNANPFQDLKPFEEFENSYNVTFDNTYEATFDNSNGDFKDILTDLNTILAEPNLKKKKSSSVLGTKVSKKTLKKASSFNGPLKGNSLLTPKKLKTPTILSFTECSQEFSSTNYSFVYESGKDEASVGDFNLKKSKSSVNLKNDSEFGPMKILKNMKSGMMEFQVKLGKRNP